MFRRTIRSVESDARCCRRVGFVDLEIRGRIACWGVSQHVCFREVDAVVILVDLSGHLQIQGQLTVLDSSYVP
jgi:hypothetical protein